MGECFFWYWPTWVVLDQRPLNGCVCVWRDARYAAQTGGSVPTCQCSAIECCDSGLTSTMNGAVAGSCGPVGAGSVNLRAGD